MAKFLKTISPDALKIRQNNFTNNNMYKVKIMPLPLTFCSLVAPGAT
jgi:hypothetical protein